MNPRKCDPSAYVAALTDSMALLAEIEGEEWAAALALHAYEGGEIDASTLRNLAGEAALRAFRASERLAPVLEAWDEEGRTHYGEAPLAVRIPFDRNAHRIGAVLARIGDFEKRANFLADEEDRRRAEALASPSHGGRNGEK